MSSSSFFSCNTVLFYLFRSTWHSHLVQEECFEFLNFFCFVCFFFILSNVRYRVNTHITTANPFNFFVFFYWSVVQKRGRNRPRDLPAEDQVEPISVPSHERLPGVQPNHPTGRVLCLHQHPHHVSFFQARLIFCQKSLKLHYHNSSNVVKFFPKLVSQVTNVKLN